MTVSGRAQILEYLDAPKPAESDSVDNMRVADLTTEQLAHVLANRRALETSDPPPPLDWEARELTVQEQAYRFAQWGRSIGVGDDLIGCNLTRHFRGLGYNDDDTVEVLNDVGIVWRPRTAEERLVAVAVEMLRDGWDEADVRKAIDGLVRDGH